MRCTQFAIELEPEDLTFIYHQARPKVVEDETTEQVFSRKDRKAYRAEVLRQRTETKRGNAKRKANAVGKEVSPKAKARRTS